MLQRMVSVSTAAFAAIASLVGSQHLMTIESINEPVEVRVDFCGTRVVPRAIYWNKRLYPIRSVNMVHHTSQGERQLFYFSVSDQTNYFKLEFDTSSLQWRLMEMYSDS